MFIHESAEAHTFSSRYGIAIYLKNRKTVKPFFSDKGPMRQKITLIENNKIIGNNKENPEIFNIFFSSIVAKLNIPKYEILSVNSANSEDPLENLITKYENHPSIISILDKSPYT